MICNEGSKNPRWLGGNRRYWMVQALKRDNWVCQECGYSEHDTMEVDHIIPKSECPELTFDLNNLMTLCPNCHRRKTIAEHKARTPWNKNMSKKPLPPKILILI